MISKELLSEILDVEVCDVEHVDGGELVYFYKMNDDDYSARINIYER